MNQLVVKRTIIFSLILGAILGILGLLPFLIGYSLFVLLFFSSVIVILYMKKNDRYLGIIDTQQGAILGAIIGFFSSIGFFTSFSPMVCIIKLIYKNYYSYAIPDAFSMGLWLFLTIVLMVAIIFSMINSVSAMGLAFILTYFEKKPPNTDTLLDIKIEDWLNGKNNRMD